MADGVKVNKVEIRGALNNFPKERQKKVYKSRGVLGGKYVSCIVVAVVCFGTFIYWSLEALHKYQSEPLTTTTYEIRSKDELIPSVTVCRFPLSSYSFSADGNYTLDDMKVNFDADLVYIMEG